MEMRRHKVSIVHWQIERGLAQHQPSDPTGNKQRHEADRKKHRCGEANSCPPQRAKPVKSLNGRRYANRKCQNRKSHRRIGTHPADEHVMSPNEKSQQPDREDCKHHRAVTEDWLARECRKNMRSRAHAGQDGYIDFRMAEEPKQMLPQYRRTTSVNWKAGISSGKNAADVEPAGNKEAGSGQTIEQQQDAAAEQHWKRQQCEYSRSEPRPTGERHTHQRHASGAHVQQRGNEIERAQQRTYAKNCYTYDPKVHAHSLPWS